MKRKPLNEKGDKQCSICKRWLPLSGYYNTKSGSYGKAQECIECNKKAYLSLTEQERRAKTIKYEFKLDWDVYISILERQSYRCAICKGPIQAHSGKHNECACVDHNHETGEIRGLLCHNCNSGLGYFGDSISRLEDAVAYLQLFKRHPKA